MNWVQLVQQGYPFRVPFSLAQAEALDRFLAGRRLGRQGRRTLHRAEAALAEDDRRRRRDNARLDQQDGTLGGPGFSSGVGDDGAAGAAAAVRRPRVPAARTSAGGGGALSATRFDGRDASADDLREWCRLNGISDAAFHEARPSSPEEQRRERLAAQRGPSEAIRHEQVLADRRRRLREAERAKQAAEPFNAMAPDVSLDAVRAKAVELGVENALIETFRKHGQALPPPPQETDPVFSRQAVERRARKAAGKDVSGLDSEAFRRLLEIRGLQHPASWWASQRAPVHR